MQLKQQAVVHPAIRRPTAFGVLLLFGLLLPVTGAAEQPAITAAELDRFIQTWPRYTEVATRDTAASSTASLVVERWGWQLDRFLYIAGQVTAGLVRLESETPAGDTATRLDDRAAAILESEHLTQQQKDDLIARIMAEAAADAEDEPDDEPDLALIRERREELQCVMDLAY